MSDTLLKAIDGSTKDFFERGILNLWNEEGDLEEVILFLSYRHVYDWFLYGVGWKTVVPTKNF